MKNMGDVRDFYVNKTYVRVSKNENKSFRKMKKQKEHFHMLEIRGFFGRKSRWGLGKPPFLHLTFCYARVIICLTNFDCPDFAVFSGCARPGGRAYR